MSENFHLLVWHDRHTDDKFFLYENLKKALEKAKSIAENVGMSEENYGYEYFAQLGTSEDYYVFVEKISLIK
jgi:hypothetical protein